MVALSHLLENKAQGVRFVAMGADHRVLWLRTTSAASAGGNGVHDPRRQW